MSRLPLFRVLLHVKVNCGDYTSYRVWISVRVNATPNAKGNGPELSRMDIEKSCMRALVSWNLAVINCLIDMFRPNKDVTVLM